MTSGLDQRRTHRCAWVLLAPLLTVAAGACDGTPTGPGGSGTIRYVAVSGSNAGNNCAVQANPCATIAQAHGSAQPGDTVQIAAGTYNEAVTIDRPIVVIGAGKGQTIVRGAMVVNSTSRPGFNEVRIQALTLSGSAGHGLSITTRGLTHTVRNVEISGSGMHGLNVEGTDGSVDIAQSEMMLNDDGIHIDAFLNVTVSMSDLVLNLNRADGLQIGGITRAITGARLTARSNGQSGIQMEDLSGGQVSIRDSCVVQNGSQPGIAMNRIPAGVVVVVDRSNIFLNTAGGAEAIALSIIPDLRNNYWGAANGPGNAGSGSGNGVTIGIQFAPFSSVPFVLTPSCQ